MCPQLSVTPCVCAHLWRQFCVDLIAYYVMLVLCIREERYGKKFEPEILKGRENREVLEVHWGLILKYIFK
jgi:hypothetical protein